MRVAVVDVGAAAVRSVVAEPTARGLRRLHDRELALRLDRVTDDGDGRAPGTIDLLHDCIARFREVHRRLQVRQVHLLVDGDRRFALETGGVLDWLAETLDAQVQPSDAVAEVAAVATAAVALGDVDGRPTLLLELDGAVARVALLQRGEVVVGARLPMAELARYAAVARPADPARWLPVATGAGPADGQVLAGTAVLLAGLLTGVTGCGVRCTDARRIDGHLARWFPAPVRERAPSG